MAVVNLYGYMTVLLLLLQSSSFVYARIAADFQLRKIDMQPSVSVNSIVVLRLGLLPPTNQTYAIKLNVSTVEKQEFKFSDKLPDKQKNMFHFEFKPYKGDRSLHSFAMQLHTLGPNRTLNGLATKVLPLFRDIMPSTHLDLAPFHHVLVKVGSNKINLLVRIYCVDGFHGESCNYTCPNPVGFKNGTYRCNGKAMECRKGWTGAKCELVNPCEVEGLTLCQNEGVCETTHTSGLGSGDTATFKCKCQPGWTGFLCDRPILYKCMHSNGTIGSFSEWGYRWEDKGLGYDVSRAPIPETMWRQTGSGTGPNATTQQGTSGQPHLYTMWRMFPEKNENTAQTQQAHSNGAVSYNMWRIVNGDAVPTNKTVLLKPGGQMGAAEPPASFVITGIKPNDTFTTYTFTESGSGESGQITPIQTNEVNANKQANQSGFTMWRQFNAPNDGSIFVPVDNVPWETDNQTPEVQHNWRRRRQRRNVFMPQMFYSGIHAPVYPPCPVPVPLEAQSQPPTPYTMWRSQFVRPDAGNWSQVCVGNATTITQTDLQRCPGYQWVENCYEVPCILLQGHPQRLPHTDLYVPLRTAVSLAYPDMVNLKPSVTYTPMVLTDGSKVTSANLHCKQNGVALPQSQLIYAFQLMPLQRWLGCAPTPVYRPAG